MKSMDSKYDYALHEQKMQDFWHKEQIYAIFQNSHEPVYTVDTPPPTVSGNLHIGHIFSYTQTDCIARYQRLNGFSVFYPFGFDDNGLATERFVEKKREITPYQIGRPAFIAVCLEEAKLAAEMFTGLWQRMGLSAYWDKTYSTIDASSRALSQESFIRLYQQGYIYRKKEPALYCTTCRTSVAQAELDDSTQESFFHTIVFKDHYGHDLLIGTTRPELLSSCVALFYHPDDIRYKHLQGQEALVPIFGHSVPIYEDKRVVPEKGTGLVMCCTFGDSADISWYKDFGLTYKQSIGTDGKWLAHTGLLAGKKRKEARLTIIDMLKKKNLYLQQVAISHAVNIHERCKQEIEYMLLDQWFLRIMDYKKTFIDLADTIEWFPSFMKTRYIDWVENIGWDWCLSRQRYYGVPFPAWHCQQCGAITLAAINNLPIDPQETPCPTVCTQCGNKDLAPDTDVMDTWNTSSLTPYLCEKLYHAVINQTDFNPFTQKTSSIIPLNMRPQAHDIIRTWAFYTIVKTWFHHKTIPWKNIVISGHVISNDKEKLSKSKEQKALSPLQLLEQYPADAIRYWTCSSTLGYDVVFAETQIKNGQRLLTKLWNAFRFLSEHRSTVSNEPKGMINEWIAHNATQCFEQYRHYFEKNEFSLALSTIEKFFWHVFCDNYLELIKNQLFHPDKYDSAIVASTQSTLYAIGLRILQMYAPFIPHITDVIYQAHYRQWCNKPSIHSSRFNDVQTAYTYPNSARIVDYIVAVSSMVRKLKTTKQLSLKTVIKELTIQASSDSILAEIKAEDLLIRGITQAETVLYIVGSVDERIMQQDDNWYIQVSIE
jgi:valyl-tRNA synthetase